MKEQFIAGNGQSIPKHEMSQLLFVSSFFWLNATEMERAGVEDTFFSFFRLIRQFADTLRRCQTSKVSNIS